MIEQSRSRFIRRSNQAVSPNKPVAAVHPRLLSRLAKAARGLIQDMRHPGDVPLPHLYRGRDFKPRRDGSTA